MLTTLQVGKYRPDAWRQLLVNSWRQSHTVAQQRPALVKSWRILAYSGIGMTTFMGIYSARRFGFRRSAKSQGWLVLSSAYIVGDTYVHLGLHRSPFGKPYRTLGPAMPLTLLRYWVGGWIMSRLFHNPMSNDEQIVALATILVTDIADGITARRTDMVSALGRYLDGEADMLAWTALTITQIRRGQIPAWFLAVFAFRWGVPVGLGLMQSFITTKPAPLVPSTVGRIAGAAHVLMAVGSIIPLPRGMVTSARWSKIKDGSVIITSLLLGATAVQHAIRLTQQMIKIRAYQNKDSQRRRG